MKVQKYRVALTTCVIDEKLFFLVFWARAVCSCFLSIASIFKKDKYEADIWHLMSIQNMSGSFRGYPRNDCLFSDCIWNNKYPFHYSDKSGYAEYIRNNEMVSLLSLVRTNFFISSSISSPRPNNNLLSWTVSIKLMHSCRYWSRGICIRFSTVRLLRRVLRCIKNQVSKISRLVTSSRQAVEVTLTN